MVAISTHAKKRMKKRLGLPKKALLKMAQKVFDEGIRHKDLKGKAKKYCDYLFLSYETANNIRIYGEYVYLFGHNNCMITTFEIPQQHKRLFMTIQKRNTN